MQTVSGRWVNPFDPDCAQLDVSDIARALSNICRFGGHSRVFYSVGQHSVLVRGRLATERRTFSSESWHWPELDGVEPIELEITPWSPDRAADEFMQRYADLEAQRN